MADVGTVFSGQASEKMVKGFPAPPPFTPRVDANYIFHEQSRLVESEAAYGYGQRNTQPQRFSHLSIRKAYEEFYRLPASFHHKTLASIFRRKNNVVFAVPLPVGETFNDIHCDLLVTCFLQLPDRRAYLTIKRSFAYMDKAESLRKPPA